ncbi:hypothetical protein ACIRRH_19390 [Kitasatospora sp. NPDC101235]|uniref:hypothetical protein n=1 Tax=Kitasatospora sp. NPDC101235 TaxID=3364101 RepID=UPI003814A6EA
MRANHATKPREPAPAGVTGARRGIARWLPRPRFVAAAGALLAQLWGFGAPGAYAAAADPPPGPARPAVRHALHDAPALDRPAFGGPALDGQSAERPVGPGLSAGAPPNRSPGPAGEPAGGGPADGVAGVGGAVGDALQERIRAGGLPLPGQRAAVPDAFALASGLLGTVPARTRPDRLRDSHEGGAADLPSAGQRHARAARPTAPRQPEAADGPVVQEAAATAVDEAAPATEPDRTPGSTAPAVPGGGRNPEPVAITGTAAAATSGDGPATATAVLAPIAAGLLLTGAAMCKHRGLPRGH